MSALLAVSGLHVRFGESHVLQGIDLEVPDGGVTALLGRNGAGKTTTLRAILGIVPRSGAVTFAGQPLERLATFRVIRRGIGYVPEDRDVFAGLTIAENLRLAERRGIAPRYEMVFDLFPDLAARRRQLAGTLSGGQQQMLAIARALLNPTRLLLVDEPTKGLSPLMVRAATEALRHAGRECAVLLVEQNLAVARELAETAVVIDDGMVAYRGTVAALMADHDLLERELGVRGQEAN